MRGKYIYGIINSNASLRLSIPKGLLLGESDSNGVVYTIPYQDISALVRNSEIVDYTHMRKDILARLLVGHQTVIERITPSQHTIIPMRLGTYAQDEAETKDILSKGYNLIKDIFERIKGKIEIDVAVTWSDFTSVVKEAGEEKEIKELKERLLNNPKEITIDTQMKIGFMLRQALDKKREKYAQETQGSLKGISLDYRTHELMDDKMVLNCAFLINKTKQKDFDKRIEELNTKFNNKLNFRCVGPLPPYSFYTLEVKKKEFKDIDWARQRLGILNESVTEEEIKKAYHKQAFSFHPDKNPGRPDAEEEFEDINKAYKILLDYCQACKQSGCSSYSFNEKEFEENALSVQVRE